MNIYSLAIAWNWEYDEDFIMLIENECKDQRISVLNLQPSNLTTLFPDIDAGRISFQSLYDRASDDDEAFIAVVEAIEDKDIFVINAHKFIERAKDKASMHLELISEGIHTPRTIILPPYNESQEIVLAEEQIEKLGKPFIIKPANTTGGGTGVVVGAESLRNVLDARQNHKNDKYLVQEHIHPVMLDDQRAWFRVYFAFGTTILCWWDDFTHIYRECSPVEEEKFGLSEMRVIVKKIQSICKLDFFSSEIALTSTGTFVVIDYVNEICDMRLKSKHPDGVPDTVVSGVARLIAERVRTVVGDSGS